MDSPLVSVVTVVLNFERFLGEAIESVLGQTFSNFEFIIVDFGSSDRSPDIASRYAARDSRIKFHVIPQCSLVEARNVACSLARARYIAIMDADDVSLPNRLEREVGFLERYPEIGMLGGAAQWMNADGAPLSVLEVPAEAHEINAALRTHFPFCHSAILMRREAFEFVAGYRRAFIRSHDYDLALRISEYFRCANLKEILVKYRIHADQVSLTNRMQQGLCKLAAQVSAASRKERNLDPFDVIEKITPEALEELGVSRSRQQAQLFADWQQWIRIMCAAGEDACALREITEVLQCGWASIDSNDIADLQLTAARLYWRQRRVLKAFYAACRALMSQPAFMARIGRALLRRLRHVCARSGHDRSGRPAEEPRVNQRLVSRREMASKPAMKSDGAIE